MKTRSRSGSLKKPDWDFGYKDPALYKLSKEEMAVRKASLLSHNREKAAEEWRNLQKKLAGNVKDQETQRVYGSVKSKSKQRSLNQTEFIRRQRSQKQLLANSAMPPIQEKPSSYLQKLNGPLRRLSQSEAQIAERKEKHEKLVQELDRINVENALITERKESLLRGREEDSSKSSLQVTPATDRFMKPVLIQDQQPVKQALLQDRVFQQVSKQAKIKQTEGKLLKLKELLKQKETMLQGISPDTQENSRKKAEPAAKEEARQVQRGNSGKQFGVKLKGEQVVEFDDRTISFQLTEQNCSVLESEERRIDLHFEMLSQKIRQFQTENSFLRDQIQEPRPAKLNIVETAISRGEKKGDRLKSMRESLEQARRRVSEFRPMGVCERGEHKENRSLVSNDRSFNIYKHL